MRFDNTDDDEREDYFEEVPEPRPQQPKEPPIPPEDPRYWEKEEDEWEHLRVPASRRRICIVVSCAAVALIAGVWILMAWMFGTVAEESVCYGYVENVELRGSVIKTYEGVLLPYKELHDTTRLYVEDFTLSLPDREGEILQTYRDSGKPVKITYRTYRAAMPWRGESRRVAVRIDTVNPRTILPVHFDANPRR